MLISKSTEQLIAIERHFITNEYHRRAICKPTDFSTFKTPALHVSAKAPIVLTLGTSRMNGSINRFYLDGYDAELEIPSRKSNQSQTFKPSAEELIGACASIKEHDSAAIGAMFKGKASVQITLARRMNEKLMLVRMKDLDLPAELYANRLAFLLDVASSPSTSTS
jgi:hypothetical protein